jgi:hypothetical protein
MWQHPARSRAHDCPPPAAISGHAPHPCFHWPQQTNQQREGAPTHTLKLQTPQSQAAAYYGTGYLRLREVFLGGAACGAVSLAVWATFGMAWWHTLGWW